MTVDEAIKNLQQAKARGVKNIILAYWEAYGFGRNDDESWEEMAEHVESKMDWSRTHEDLDCLLEEFENDDE